MLLIGNPAFVLPSISQWVKLYSGKENKSIHADFLDQSATTAMELTFFLRKDILTTTQYCTKVQTRTKGPHNVLQLRKDVQTVKLNCFLIISRFAFTTPGM